MAVDNNYPAVTFTPAELKHLCVHAGFDPERASILTGILCYHESNGRWNLWRPREENPLGGNDWSGAMVNDKAWTWAGPWMMADPVLTLRWVAERILTTPAGFGHYKYPSTSRTAESIHLDEMRIAEPVNPFWKMRDAGMFAPVDMRPEAEVWVRWMPSAVEFPGGTGGYYGMSPNDVTVRLQEALRRAGFFTTWNSTWYGDATRAGVTELQRLLAAAGFNVGSADGNYGPKTANTWIRGERYRHLTR